MGHDIGETGLDTIIGWRIDVELYSTDGNGLIRGRVHRENGSFYFRSENGERFEDLDGMDIRYFHPSNQCIMKRKIRL